jgi:hypothetical protein
LHFDGDLSLMDVSQGLFRAHYHLRFYFFTKDERMSHAGNEMSKMPY